MADSAKIKKSNILFLKAAKICLKSNLPFAIFKFPNKNKFSIVVSKREYTEVEMRKYKKLSFVFAPFNATKTVPSIFLKNNILLKDLKNLANIKNSKKNIYSATLRKDQQTTTKSEYENNFKKYMQSFEDGKLKKAILSRRIIQNIDSNYNVLALFKKINKVHTTTFNYIFFSPAAGLWVGATPEILVQYKNNLFKTPALAGTLPAGSKEDWGEKEKEEHQLVCDRIIQVYKKHHLKLLDQKDTVDIETGAVKHLLTNFIFKKTTRKFEFQKFLGDLHPTPAVGGYPKKNAMELILKTEKHNREYYSGYLGVANKKSAQLFVNLRCAKINKNKAIIFVGGGLTKNSIMEDEWNETELKSKTILNLL